MEYYYIDGTEKRGPFSIDELKEFSIDNDTLFWHEGLAQWTKLQDLDILKNQIKPNSNVPPPLPKKILIEKDRLNKSNSKRKIYLIMFYIIGGILLIASIGVAYYKFLQNVKEDKLSLTSRISNIFQGKSSISDGEIYSPQGNLKKIKMPKPFKNAKAKNQFLEKLTYDIDLSTYKQKTKEGVFETFTLTNGGFTIFKLTQQDKGFVFEKTTSSDLEYTSGLYNYIDGYRFPSYRPSIQQCYTKSYEFFTSNDKSGSYVPNSFSAITNFEFLRSQFHYVGNVNSPISPYTKHWFQDLAGNIYTPQYKVYYNKDFRYFEVIEDKSKFKSHLVMLLSIGVFIGLILLIGSIAIGKYIINHHPIVKNVK